MLFIGRREAQAVKGTPAVPDAENEEAGLTERTPTAVVMREACRVVLPMPSVALVKKMVSE